MYVATDPTGRITTMFMAQTWVFGLTRTGGSEASGRWERARAWRWSRDWNATGTASVARRARGLSVATSDRQIPRAPAGFAHPLRQLSRSGLLSAVGPQP